MIKISNKDIYKDGEKVGWFEGKGIFSESGEKIGYISGNDINDARGNKIAYLVGEDIKRVGKDNPLRSDEINRQVTGGTLNELERSAAFIFFG